MQLPAPFRAEHIGSLLRPTQLLRARNEHAAGRIGREELTAVENAAIRDAVRLQEDAGLAVITDGQFRRGTYSDSFTSSGISGVSIELTEDRGWTPSRTHGNRTARRIPRVESRITWNGGQNADDFRFLKSVTHRIPKITLPGPCYIHYRAGRANISRDAYPDLDTFWQDLVCAYTEEMRSLAGAGCTYLQIDETSLVKLGDPRARALLKERGDDWTLPGGWIDPGESPSEAAARETKEESGYDVDAIRIIAIYDRDRQGHPPCPFHVYKLIFLCALAGGSAKTSLETEAACFFREDELPVLSESRVLLSQVKRAFAFARDPNLPADFD